MKLHEYTTLILGNHNDENGENCSPKNIEGYFTCDGYQAYHSLPGRITVTGCMAHARRRFDEALTVLKKDFTKEQLKETTAYQAMERIGMLYKIEEMIRDKSPEERIR